MSAQTPIPDPRERDDVRVTFLVAVINFSDKRHLKEGKICFGSQLKGVVQASPPSPTEIKLGQ